MIKASVVVTTHNRPAYLKQCLEALAFQSLDKVSYEILVVDSYSNNINSDLNQKVFNEISRANPGLNIRYFYNPIISGAVLSRNTGVDQSSSDLIILADDDSIPSYSYVEAAIIGYHKSNADIVFGRMLPNYEQPPEPDFIDGITTKLDFGWYIEDFSVYDYGDKIKKIPWNLGFGQNCAMSKSFYLNSGGVGPDGFSPPYYYWNGSGEHHYTMQADKIFYLPEMLAGHCITKDRFENTYFYSRSRFYGVGESFSQVARGERPLFSIQFFKSIFRDLYQMSKYSLKGKKIQALRKWNFMKAYIGHQYYTHKNPALLIFCRRKNWTQYDFAAIYPIGEDNAPSQWSIIK